MVIGTTALVRLCTLALGLSVLFALHLFFSSETQLDLYPVQLLNSTRVEYHFTNLSHFEDTPLNFSAWTAKAFSLPHVDYWTRSWKSKDSDKHNPWRLPKYASKPSYSNNGLSICDIGFGILTSPKFAATRIQHVTHSWVRRLCTEEDNFFFVSNDTIPELDHPTMVVNCSDRYEQLCCKSRQNVFLLDQALPHRKWYMKIDDDTLVVPETLVDELSKYDWRQPYLIGCPYFLILDRKTLKQKIYGRPLKPWGSLPDDQFGPVSENFMYASGGSGYVWSWGMMQLLKQNLTVFEDYCVRSTFEDVGFGLAVYHYGGKVIGHPGFFVDPPQKHVSEEDLQTLPVTWHLAHETELMPLYDALVHALVDLPRNSSVVGQDWTDVQRTYPNQFRGNRGNRVSPRQQQGQLGNQGQRPMPAVVEVQAGVPAPAQENGAAQRRVEPTKDPIEQAKEERKRRFDNVRFLPSSRPISNEDIDMPINR